MATSVAAYARIDQELASGASAPAWWIPTVLAIVAGAWLVAALAQLTGIAPALHHHALIEGGPPPWVALPLFLLAWQPMVGAMMLPASLPAFRGFGRATSRLGRPGSALVLFLGAYAAVWTAFGLVAFVGDEGLHRLVDATPWLGARPWLIAGGLLALAGAYQLLPAKRRALEACREPVARLDGTARPLRTAVQQGVRHGIDCLACSWALMLVMFGAGFANLWWMAGLTVAMTYETLGLHGRRAASATGVLLLGLACVVVSTGWAALGSS